MVVQAAQTLRCPDIGFSFSQARKGMAADTEAFDSFTQRANSFKFNCKISVSSCWLPLTAGNAAHICCKKPWCQQMPPWPDLGPVALILSRQSYGVIRYYYNCYYKDAQNLNNWRWFKVSCSFERLNQNWKSLQSSEFNYMPSIWKGGLDIYLSFRRSTLHQNTSLYFGSQINTNET